MKTDNRELFETLPVRRAVLSLIVPTIISQLITVIYNMADTFFIGQLNDPNQVAAVSLCMPIFILLTGIANLFGIGGASLIARSLGVGDTERARSAASFSVWTAAGVSLAYGLLLLFFRPVLLPLVGANEGTFEYCYRYCFWTVTIGGVPTVMNALLAHLVRAEGYSKQASFGVAMGGILNIILDPIFISTFGLEIAGAAIATMISNVIAVVFFVIFIRKRWNSTVITPYFRCYTWKHALPREILLVGLPSSLLNLMGVFSNIMLNNLLAGYCNEAVAGIGIAKKVDMMVYAISNGISQGVLPLIGYNYAAKNYKRMRASVRTTLIFSLCVAVTCVALLFTCAGPLVRAFIDDALTVHYGQMFQRIICITGPCLAVAMTIIATFQAVGKKVQPLILSLMRKGGLDVPFMFLMRSLAGIDGIVWATPISDFLGMVFAVLFFLPFWKKLRAEEAEAEAELSDE